MSPLSIKTQFLSVLFSGTVGFYTFMQNALYYSLSLDFFQMTGVTFMMP